jgi:hypothetical protein
MGDEKLLDTSADEKATLATSRRSFIAGWKLCAAAALGLGLAARSASAQQNTGQQGQNNNPQNPGQKGQNRGR